MKWRLLAMRAARLATRSRLLTGLMARALLLRTRIGLRPGGAPVVVILSLGADGHSYSAARAARQLGLRVVLVSPKPVLHEMAFARYLLRLDPLRQTDQVIARLRPLAIEGVLLSIKHVLLPAQARIAEALGQVSCGHIVAELANDKFAWRTALAAAGIAQPRFSEDRSAVADIAVVQKPRRGTGSKGVAFLAPGAPARPELLPEGDRSVGQTLYFEEYVEGEQFDVEGVSRDGTHRMIAIIKEKYARIDDAFPPKYFRFNPDHAPDFLARLEQAAYAVLDASGVVNGAWHVEIRHRDGIFLPIDFANRMGYERFVSRASGLDFAQQHVACFVRRLALGFQRRPRALLQVFATRPGEQDALKRIAAAHPEAVFDAILQDFPMSTVTYHGMIVLDAPDSAHLAQLTRSLVLEP